MDRWFNRHAEYKFGSPHRTPVICTRNTGAMLHRQQATAVVAARFKIVEDAVSMVHMALEELAKQDVIELNEERKAAMVSNLRWFYVVIKMLIRDSEGLKWAMKKLIPKNE